MHSHLLHNDEMKYVQGNVPHVSNILAKFITTVSQGTSLFLISFFFYVLVGKATSLPTQIQTNRTAATLVMSHADLIHGSSLCLSPGLSLESFDSFAFLLL